MPSEMWRQQAFAMILALESKSITGAFGNSSCGNTGVLGYWKQHRYSQEQRREGRRRMGSFGVCLSLGVGAGILHSKQKVERLSPWEYLRGPRDSEGRGSRAVHLPIKKYIMSKKTRKNFE